MKMVHQNCKIEGFLCKKNHFVYHDNQGDFRAEYLTN